MAYRISIDGGMSGKICNPYKGADYEYSFLVFNWWFWRPRFSRNDGRFKLKSQCVEFNFHWLCFWVSFYFWRKPPVSKGPNDAK